MNRSLSVLLAAVIVASSALVPGHAQGQQPPTVQMPQPGVPQIMTLEGNFVRAAYNNDGYVIIGYQMAQRSIGEPWIMLEVGMTLMEGKPDYTLKRDDISLEIPDGGTVPLPTMTEYRKAEASLQALQNRAKVQRDSINYFPPMASQACRLGFFADLDQRVMGWDQVELSYRRACLGRLYFQVPNGIAYGQHWLNVKFANSVVRVPFRILTKDEEKLLSKNFKDIKKQIDAAFRKKS